MKKGIFCPDWVMRETEHLARYKLIVFFFLFPFFISAQSFSKPEVDYLVKSGIWHLLVNNYPEANRHFNLLKKYFPENPLSDLTRAISVIAEDADKGIPFETEKINPLLEQAELNSEKFFDNGSRDWGYFFLGATAGLQTFREYLQKDYFSVLFDGIDAIDNFNSCLSVNPNFHAANIGIGSYKYWKSEALSAYDWLPFFTDEREQGIKQLTAAVKSYSYMQAFGEESLIWIYLHMKQYDKALTIAENSLKKYPNSRSFLWGYIHAVKNVSREKMILALKELLNLFEADGIDNRIRKIEIFHKIASQLAALGRNREALEYCEKALSIKNITSFEQDKLGDRISRIKTLRGRLKEKIKN